MPLGLLYLSNDKLTPIVDVATNLLYKTLLHYFSGCQIRLD